MSFLRQLLDVPRWGASVARPGMTSCPCRFDDQGGVAEVYRPGPYQTAYYLKPRKMPSPSTLSANSSQSMLAIVRLFCTDHISDGTTRNVTEY